MQKGLRDRASSSHGGGRILSGVRLGGREVGREEGGRAEGEERGKKMVEERRRGWREA